MDVFVLAYWAGLALEVVLRLPYRNAWKSSAKTDRRVSRTDTALVGLLSVPMLLLPLIYSVTDWLAFADYSLPSWMGWLGVFLLACAVLVFGRAHADLRSNWSPSLEISENHTLVTGGIYRSIRHPMYASQWLWCVAQALLLQNWLAGPVGLLYFALFYIFRVRAEEQMMLDTFGEQYRQYMTRTGRVIPKLR